VANVIIIQTVRLQDRKQLYLSRYFY